MSYPFDLKVIRSSFAEAGKIADQVAEKFYEILWDDYPQSVALFEEVDMDQQKKALMGSLSFIVNNLEDTDKIVGFIKEMGRRHSAYGAQEEHFDWVGKSLIKTLAHFFGDNWTEDLEKNWVAAYGLIADVMNQGLQEAASPEPRALNELASQLARELFEKALQEQAEDQFYQMAKDKAEELLRKALRDVAEEQLKAA